MRHWLGTDAAVYGVHILQRSTPDVFTLGATAQNLLRVIIASYFIALSLGMISGATLSPLAAMLISEQLASLMSSLLMFGLASLVMLGLHIRPAALLLGLITLAGSFVTLNASGVAENLGAFWRDLVLVAALVLTYSENAPRDRHKRRALRQKVAPRRVTPKPATATTLVATPCRGAKDANAPRRLNKTWVMDDDDSLNENIFAEDGVYA